jgi:CheY-like chemotaxis protein
MSTLLKNITILIIDDDADTCELLRTLLKEYGTNVMVANSVDAALALCRRAPPHLVVSDIRLGSSDGFALIETIRQYNKEYRGYTPAIAITGFGSPGDEERALAAGFNAYIPKPFDPIDLINTITSLLRNTAGLAA